VPLPLNLTHGSARATKKIVPVIIVITVVLVLLWIYLVAPGPEIAPNLVDKQSDPSMGPPQAKPITFNRVRRSFDISFLFRRCVATHHPSFNPLSR
jgi:hypothetical protein